MEKVVTNPDVDTRFYSSIPMEEATDTPGSAYVPRQYQKSYTGENQCRRISINKEILGNQKYNKDFAANYYEENAW